MHQYLTPRVAAFSHAYERDDVLALMEDAWRSQLDQLRADLTLYEFLDAAQLVKHYLGLRRRHRDAFTLLYLYWEPTNADAHGAFAAHREEVAGFAEAVGGPGRRFVSMSYSELWDSWEEQGSPAWLGEHVANLRVRYDVAI